MKFAAFRPRQGNSTLRDQPSQFFSALLSNQKVYILPSRAGIFAGFSIILMVMVGTGNDSNLVFILAFFLMIIFFSTMFQANAALKHVVVEQIESSPTPVDGTATLHFSLKTKDQSDVGMIYVEAVGKPWRQTMQILKGAVPGGSEQATSKFQPFETGIFDVARVALHSRFPFGLWHVWKYQAVSHELVVHPRPVQIQKLPLPTLGLESHVHGDGEHGEDYHQHRSYQVSDSFQHVDWKAYSRGAPLLIKEFTSGVGQHRRLDWRDIQHDQKAGQLVDWVQTCHAAGEPFEICLPDYVSPLSHSSLHLADCLKRITVHEENRRQST